MLDEAIKQEKVINSVINHHQNFVPEQSLVTMTELNPQYELNFLHYRLDSQSVVSLAYSDFV
jgi:hypothetical protein